MSLIVARLIDVCIASEDICITFRNFPLWCYWSLSITGERQAATPFPIHSEFAA